MAPTPRRPLTGARIETSPSGSHRRPTMSPSHGGADRNPELIRPSQSRKRRPLTGRGSKQREDRERLRDRQVALSRGRGSKHRQFRRHRRRHASPSHGGADRNVVEVLGYGVLTGRPLTGARIETCPGARSLLRRLVALSRGRGSKPSPPAFDPQDFTVALSRGRGSKPARAPLPVAALPSPSHGGADRHVVPI